MTRYIALPNDNKATYTNQFQFKVRDTVQEQDIAYVHSRYLAEVFAEQMNTKGCIEHDP